MLRVNRACRQRLSGHLTDAGSTYQPKRATTTTRIDETFEAERAPEVGELLARIREQAAGAGRARCSVPASLSAAGTPSGHWAGGHGSSGALAGRSRPAARGEIVVSSAVD